MSTKFYNLDLDNTLGGNSPSDYKNPSQKAIKEYVDTKTMLVSVLSDIGGDISLNPTGLNVADDSNDNVVITSGVPMSIDSELSLLSENPVQNKVITQALNNVDALPSQSENAGKFLTTNGTNASWADIPVDSTLSNSSTNPLQNKVLYPSLSNFIPSGTTIDVKLDGSGDFTTFASAISYLNGKWSNGSISIKLGEGTHTMSEAITLSSANFNIPRVTIMGVSRNSSTLSFNNSSYNDTFMFTVNGANVNFTSLAITNNCANSFNHFILLQYPITMSNIRIGGCNITNFARVCWAHNGFLTFEGYNNISFAENGIASTGGKIQLYNSTMNIEGKSGQQSAFFVNCGGIISINGATINYTNVSNHCNSTANTWTKHGYIGGVLSNGQDFS